MKQHNKLLEQQAKSLAPLLHKKHGILCKQLPFDDGSAPLYLAKPHWTNRFDQNRESTIGIFCAIWLTPQLVEQGQFAYNIHSLKLRKLPGYKLGSKIFASQFRNLVKQQVRQWPGIRLDYGPMTLLEGRDCCELNSFAEKVEQRVSGFVGIHQHIDNLLEKSSTINK